MNCIKKDCEKTKCCKKAHELNNIEFGIGQEVLIPNNFFYELNFSNKFVKRGISKDGFQFGCMKLIESNQNCYSLYINNQHITDFDHKELVQCCNEAFSEMVKNGEIKIGL